MTTKKKGFFQKLFNPGWDTILTQAINFIFLLFGNKIKGYRTVIVNVVTALVGGLMAFRTDAFFDFICGLGLDAFCGGENAVAWGYSVTIISLLNIVLRKVTGDELQPAEFSIGGNSKLRPIAVIAFIALVVVIATIIF